MNRELSSEALTVLASACQVTLRAEIDSETRSAIWLATGRSSWFAEDISADDRQLLSEVGDPDPDDVGWCHAPVGELTAMVLDLDRPDALDVLDEESGDWLALGENLLALWSDNGRRVALLIDDFELHALRAFNSHRYCVPRFGREGDRIR